MSLVQAVKVTEPSVAFTVKVPCFGTEIVRPSLPTVAPDGCPSGGKTVSPGWIGLDPAESFVAPGRTFDCPVGSEIRSSVAVGPVAAEAVGALSSAASDRDAPSRRTPARRADHGLI